MLLRSISRKTMPLLVALAFAVPAQAQSTDPHHDDQQTQTAPQLPGSAMGGGMVGGNPMAGNPGGMAGMMQMMQMMQSSQMMQMAQMMQMMQMMQALPGTPGGGMGGMGMGAMPGNGMSMMGGGAAAEPIDNIEAAIAYYKAAIGITDAQATPWNAFADALRATAKQLQQARQSGEVPVTALDQLARKSVILEAEVAATRQIEPSARALYAVLSPAQKRTADLLMTEHLARM